jgi:hypothetical protein
MLDTEQDLVPPPSSPSVRQLLELRNSGQPISLSINGKLQLQIQDQTSFGLLLDLADRVDLLETLQERIADFDRGTKGLSLEEFKEEALRKGVKV